MTPPRGGGGGGGGGRGRGGSSRGRGKPKRSRGKRVPTIDEVMQRNAQESEEGSGGSDKEGNGSEDEDTKKEEGDKKEGDKEGEGGKEGKKSEEKSTDKTAENYGNQNAQEEEEEDSSDDDILPANPNRGGSYIEKTGVPELTRRQKEQLDRDERDRNIDELRAQGKTHQSKLDLERLAAVRARREEEKRKKEESK
eukprot:GHVQ01010826.1.p3 GENE.GHVQ01010826.1~~GHVQ01010826.1.p3  ORF type:complete len:196 (-),score=72.16 GHVQ01010826.1:1358-1945(-)